MAWNAIQFQKGYSLAQFMEEYGTEEQCTEALFHWRWPNGFVCPRCEHTGHWCIPSRALYQCRACRHQVSLTAGTILASTKLSLRTWFLALYQMTQTKNGISALELSRQLGVSYNTAWWMKHKLMQVMKERDDTQPLSGWVQLNDAYWGGQRRGGKRGRGAPGKTPLVATVQLNRHGHATRMSLSRINALQSKMIAAWAKSHLEPGTACHCRSTSPLLREIRALGYPGGYSQLTAYVRTIRPPVQPGFEHRFETAPGEQAPVDFAQFKTVLTSQPDPVRVVWLFSLVLGYSRFLAGRFVFGQNLASVLRGHRQVLQALGGVPRRILYDRMKTVVLGKTEDRHVIYHPKLLELGAHYGFAPRACAAYRAKTKGKVERPFRSFREDFFLARSFKDMDDLNSHFSDWLATVANARCHGTTRRVVEGQTLAGGEAR